MPLTSSLPTAVPMCTVSMIHSWGYFLALTTECNHSYNVIVMMCLSAQSVIVINNMLSTCLAIQFLLTHSSQGKIQLIA